MSSNKLKSIIPAKRNQRIILIASLLLAVCIAFAASYTLAQNSKSQTKPGAITNNGRLADKDGKPVYEVELKKDNKQPIDLLVKKGDYVQFNSKDGGEHQIIQGLSTNTEHGEASPAESDHKEAGDSRPEKSKVLDSGVIKPNEGYLLQFNTAGKFEFHDNYNHDYTITILVYDQDSPKKLQ